MVVAVVALALVVGAVTGTAAPQLRGGAMAGGPLLKSGAQSQRSEPVTPRAVVVLRGGGARRLRTLHRPEPQPQPTPHATPEAKPKASPNP